MGLRGGGHVGLDDGDGADCGGGGGGGGQDFGCVSCSICLEAVSDNGCRSWAKLQCGHEFHLDCIGSAFNVKGAMQCPNCRKIEKGQWLYANGSRTVPELSIDWAHDEDLYDHSYSEMGFGVHWCPFGSLTRLPSSFEEGEFLSAAYHDAMGQRAVYAEQAAGSSATTPCPYIAYLGPIHPSSSNSTASISDGSHFNNHWHRQSRLGELPTAYAYPSATGLQHHSWEHRSPPFTSSASHHVNGADPLSTSPAPQRSARIGSNISRSGSFMHPLVVGHSSTARAGSSVGSTTVPYYPGSNARTRDRVQALQAYYQQQQPGNSSRIQTSMIAATRRSNSHRGLGHVASSSDQGGLGHLYQEIPTRYHARDRDRQFPSFSQQDHITWQDLYRAMRQFGPE